MHGHVDWPAPVISVGSPHVHTNALLQGVRVAKLTELNRMYMQLQEIEMTRTRGHFAIDIMF